MKIRMLQSMTAANDVGHLAAGETYDVPDTLGAELVERGWAQAVRKKAAAPPAKET